MFAKRRIFRSGVARRNGGRNSGIALVVILACLVLISIIFAVFLTQATLSRRISFSSAGQFRAENIAFCGLDTIVGDLRSEIAAGSTATTVNGITLFHPVTNGTAVPFRVANDGFPNVVKKSIRGSNFWKSGAPYTNVPASPARASADSTTNASVNGRYVAVKQWNDPLLMDSSFTNAFTPPDWILVTRRGASADGDALPDDQVLADASPGNLDYVLGRFAYMIYNEGGLLDVTVAGFPDGMGADFTGRRGLLPQVDLAKIPGIHDADALIQWRNKSSAATAAAYRTFVFANTNGFTAVAPGDQTFVSRQDLIRYVQDHPDQVSPDALQFLGTFSRELNAPSFSPAPSRPRTLPGEGYRASPSTEQDDLFNPSLVETRVTEPFVRVSDGTSAQVGEPLLKNRFPLSRLDGLRPDGPATPAHAADIAKFFGLTWNSAAKTWTYRSGASSINRLAEVAAEDREPDFFELLQAGITIGSLGKMAGDGNSVVSPLDGNTFYQIMQIGANLIDQYDADSFPTRIAFGAEIFSGIENLPYLTRVVEMAWRYAEPGSTPPYSHNVGLWYQPEVWNPHAQAQTFGPAPNRFRYRVTGVARGFVGGNGPTALSAPNTFAGSPGIEFSRTSAHDFSEPTLLSPEVGATAANAKDSLTFGGQTHVGIWVGDVLAKDKWLQGGLVYYNSARVQPDPLVTHELQYWNGSAWVTYDAIRNVAEGASVSEDHFFIEPVRKTFMVRSDPRSDRFGVGASSAGPTVYPTAPLHQTVRSDAGNGFLAWQWGTAPGWDITTYFGSPAIYSGLLSENKQLQTRYRDPDGTLRMADGAYTTGTLPNGYPLAMGNFPSRPLILNRPFRSVAEMGYASRGMPWKHLDFFTQESGDAALLDLFCLNEHAGNPLVAGRLDPNTRQQAVLEAVFSGAMRTEETDGLVSASEAVTLAESLLSVTSGTAGPLQNRADLVTRWLGDPAVLSGSTADTIIKRRREAAVRALADISNTRTWNLLIDIIAQSGRYTGATHKFTVAGERRYWLHLALDRYTGKVVSHYLEPVYE